MVANPKPGAFYWTIAPFIWDVNNGDKRPRMPWRGQYSVGGVTGLPYLDPVDERGQQDPGSLHCARTFPQDLFPDREQALRAYAREAARGRA